MVPVQFDVVVFALQLPIISKGLQGIGKLAKHWTGWIIRQREARGPRGANIM